MRGITLQPDDGRRGRRIEEMVAAEQVKESSRRLYDELNRQLDSTDLGASAYFLNFGLAEEDRDADPECCLDEDSRHLVLEVVRGENLDGRRVLDVGCGRGGTVVTIAAISEPSRLVGLDLSSQAVDFCRSEHGAVAEFQVGDAEELPFGDGSFDAVVNIESSHGYPELKDFYSEVSRVLAAGGTFLYADFLSLSRFEKSVRVLRRLGFDLQRERDISLGVLRSNGRSARARARAFGAGADQEVLREFLAMPGSQLWDSLQSGDTSYRIYTWRKPG